MIGSRKSDPAWHCLLLGMALASFVFCELSAQDRLVQEARSPDQLMDGEKVLAVKEAPLLNPIHRQASQVWFELQNVRPGNVLRDALEIDYAYDGTLSGPIHLVVHTNGKRLRFPVDAGALANHQGVLKCSYDSVADKSPIGADLEAYVELTESDLPPQAAASAKANLAKKEPSDPLFFKVSKSATRGNVETLTYGRQMRDSEQRIFLARKKKYGPPPAPPAGSKLLPSDLMLVPGTPVFAALEGEWLKAEVLAVSPKEGWVVHWPHLGHKANSWLRATHLALTDDTIEKLRPVDGIPKFKPSQLLAKGSLQPPPEGYAVLPAVLELVPGTPVKVFLGGSYWEYTVVENGVQTVSLVSNAFGRSFEAIERGQIIIEKDVGRRLKDPKLQAELAERLKTLLSANSRPAASSSRSARSYATTQLLPLGHVKVSTTTELKVGDRGVAYWGNSWLPVVVTAVPPSGDVEIQWEGWSSRELITRDSLALPEKSTPASNAKPEPTPTVPKVGSSASKLFALNLVDPGPRKIQVAKLIMSLNKMSLNQANEVVENTPIELRNDLSQHDAESWKKQLELFGAKVKVEAPNP